MFQDITSYYKFSNGFSALLWKISVPLPRREFWFVPPLPQSLWNSSFSLYFLCNFWLLTLPSPMEFQKTLLGMVY